MTTTPTDTQLGKTLLPCEWCKQRPETWAEPGEPHTAAVRCSTSSCPVRKAGWVSPGFWNTRAAVAGPRGDESGWLLQKMHEGNVRYICADQLLQWTDDPNKALRLARREDAEALTSIVEDCEKIAEHEWTSSGPPPSCAFCDSGLVFNELEITTLSDLYERTGLRTAQILKHALALYQLHIVKGVDVPLESKLPDAATSSPAPVESAVVAGRVVNINTHGEPTRARLREIETSVSNGYEREYRELGWSRALQSALRDLHFLLTFFRDDVTSAAPADEGTHRCPHCGRTMRSDFDEDVGLWYECDNCDYREAIGEQEQVVVIDGKRRRVIPCPDGREGCEVLHTEPITTTSDSARRTAEGGETCQWKFDPDGYWQTSCDDQFCIADGTPAENRMIYCHHCGRRLVTTDAAAPADNDAALTRTALALLMDKK